MVQIITDSTSDLSKARQEALGVEVAPLSVHFGEESFLDGVDLTNEAFYVRLRAAQALPTTAQVNPEEFVRRFQAHRDRGDDVVALFIASKLSGTCQSAMIAREMVDPDHIFVIDSDTVTFGLGLLVEMAARLRDQGLSAREIAEELERLKARQRFYAVVETLKYLKMGGRISGAAAVVGGMLGITPILDIRDGVVQAAGKARGRKAPTSGWRRRSPPSRWTPLCPCPSATPTPPRSWPSARPISRRASPAWRSWRAPSAPSSAPMRAPAAPVSPISSRSDRAPRLDGRAERAAAAAASRRPGSL